MNEVAITDLIGKTLIKVEKSKDNTEIVFTGTGGESWVMHHDQDCCESVRVQDIAGDLDDLTGSPIVRAEENSSKEWPDGGTPEYTDSFTWTFYRIGTVKGTVVIRWLGESNGYYSESVSFARVQP